MSVVAALEAGGEALAAALKIDGEVVSRAAEGKRHSEAALPLLTELLAEKGLTLGDCDAFAYGAGPGKFSALRLVCAIAKTLAYANGKALVAVPSLAAMAAAAIGDAALSEIRCAIPAHRGHLFYAACRREGEIWRTPGVAVLTADAPKAAKPAAACGDWFARHPEWLGNRGELWPAADAAATGAATARIGAAMLAAGETTPPLSAAPMYVRQRVALTTAERLAAKKATEG